MESAKSLKKLSRVFRPMLTGRWDELPDKLSVDELNHLGHMISGYDEGETHLKRHPFEVAESLRAQFDATGKCTGNAIELMVGLFGHVRGWRGLYEGPYDGDRYHMEALAIYRALRDRVVAHPDELSFEE